MRASFTIDRSSLASSKSKLQAEINRYMLAKRSEFAAALRETAGEMAVALGERTFPGDGAIGYTVRSVRADVSQVYAQPGRIYEILKASDPRAAGAFWGAIKNGDISKAREIVRSSGTAIAGIEIGTPLRPSLHRDSRDPKTGHPNTRGYPLQLVSKEELEAYTKAVVKEIGKTAAGWFAAADDLGADGNAVRWKGIGVHGKGGGTALIEIGKYSIVITLVNSGHLAKKHISPSQLARIRQRANEQLISRLKERMKQAA